MLLGRAADFFPTPRQYHMRLYHLRLTDTLIVSYEIVSYEIVFRGGPFLECV